MGPDDCLFKLLYNYTLRYRAGKANNDTDWADTGQGLGRHWADTGQGLGRHWAVTTLNYALLPP